MICYATLRYLVMTLSQGYGGIFQSTGKRKVIIIVASVV
jgi:hypothetical protein